jgi:hypothetical protein
MSYWHNPLVLTRPYKSLGLALILISKFFLFLILKQIQQRFRTIETNQKFLTNTESTPWMAPT